MSLPPAKRRGAQWPHIRNDLLCFAAVAVILYFDTLNKSEERLKPGLLTINFREEWLYLLLHVLSSAFLAWFAFRSLDQRAYAPLGRSSLASAIALALVFQTSSEIYQTATLPYHQPLPDFLADLAGIAGCLGAGRCRFLSRRPRSHAHD